MQEYLPMSCWVTLDIGYFILNVEKYSVADSGSSNRIIFRAMLSLANVTVVSISSAGCTYSVLNLPKIKFE